MPANGQKKTRQNGGVQIAAHGHGKAGKIFLKKKILLSNFSKYLPCF